MFDESLLPINFVMPVQSVKKVVVLPNVRNKRGCSPNVRKSKHNRTRKSSISFDPVESIVDTLSSPI